MNNIEYIFTQTGDGKHSVTLPIKTITSTWRSRQRLSLVTQLVISDSLLY